MRNTQSKYLFITALALAAIPGIAAAMDDSTAGERTLLTPAGEYFLVGGGLTNFADADLRDSFNVGGAWEARIGYGSRFFVGGELAYVGSARGADQFGFDLLSNGGEAVVRLQYPYLVGSWLLEPFAFGGIGWNHLSIRDADPGMPDSDNIGVIPFGAGLSAGYRGLLVDARFTYRPTFSDEELRLTNNGTVGNLQSWAITASVGYEF
jgi:hypothetical protein